MPESSMKYQLIIFDWDGTLMDSAGEIVAAMQQSIARMKLPPRDDQALRRLIGLGLEDAFRRLYPDMTSSDLATLMAAYRRHYGGTPRVYGELFPGVEAELDQLARQQRRLAVATGKSRAGLDKALDAIGWHGRFHATRCADETRSKPHPLMLEELLDELRLHPQQALMVGDTSYDMEMARSAGVDALGVAWGVHEEDELRDAGAQDVVAAIPGLGDWLRLRAG